MDDELARWTPRTSPGCSVSSPFVIVVLRTPIVGIRAPSMSEQPAARDDDNEFRVDVETSNGPAVVVVAGELDLYTAPELRERLARVDEGGAERVVLDLSQVTLVDSMALGVLLGAKKRLAMHAGSLDVVISKPDIRRIFEITMLDRVFTLYASRDEALQADGAASADSVE
jgi:anti-sigma B factor antagonist